MVKYNKTDAETARADLAFFFSELYRKGEISTPTATRALYALSVLEKYAGLDERSLTLFNHGAAPGQKIRL